jgi:hypothetical protein
MTAPAFVREDLSQRTGLSKSALTTFAICPQKTFQRKYHPMPFIGKPKVTFGSCVDVAVEILAKCARAGIELDFDVAMAASREKSDLDVIEVDQAEVEFAIRSYAADVMPHFDWTFCRTQARIHLPLFDWGEADGHPDLIFSSNAVWDNKTSAYPKKTAKTIELGYYALQVEEETGRPVPEVGYLNFVRDGGYWQGFGSDALGERELKSGPRKGQMIPTGHQIPSVYVDDEFRRWTRAVVSGYVLADRTDDLLNGKQLAMGREPLNFAFGGQPVNWSFCSDCEYNPLFGGSCLLAPAHTEDATDDI